MSSFFTLPASQRKRRREPSASSSKNKRPATKKVKDAVVDEEVSGSESDSAPRRGQTGDYEDSDSDSGNEEETVAEKRLRLAQRYLENIKTEVDDAGFDAADVDRDLIADRLKEDTAVTKGRVYRFISADLDVSGASKLFFRTDGNPVYAIAANQEHIFTARKDGSLVKWEVPTKTDNNKSRRPIKRGHTKGRMVKPVGKGKGDAKTFIGHQGAILSIAISPSGRFIATGGKDKRVILWTTSNMKPFRAFSHHRGPVTSLAFKLQTASGSSQNKTTASETLYSASLDRSIKVWAIDKLTSAYTETLFGHQDSILSVDTLFEDRCISVGSRDRTVRLWKVSEESQMIYRAGGFGALPRPGKAAAAGLDEGLVAQAKSYHEGSTDCVAILDNELFVTGSDNGAISLWSTQKKKPVFTYPLAHGLDRKPRPDEYYADEVPKEVVGLKELARGITALRAIPLSDLFVTGSWDGYVRAWKLRADRKGFDALGPLGVDVRVPRAITEGKSSGVDQLESLTSPDSELSVATSTMSLLSSASAAAEQKEAEEKGEEGEKQLELTRSTSLSPLNESDEVESRSLSSTGPIVGIINDLSVFERGERGEEKVVVVAAVGKEHRLMRRLVVASDTVAQDGRNGSVIFEISRRV